MLYAEEAEATMNRHIMMSYMMLWKGKIHKPKQQK